MDYPLLSEYIESIKSPEDNFDELKHLRPVLDDDGHPMMSSGNFAVVFKMKDEQTGKLHAIKCFLKEQEGRAEAYRQIAEELEYVNSTYLTPIKYLDKELFVDSKTSNETEFPVLLMDWIDGVTLDKYIRNHINDEYKLSLLAYQFSRLAMWLMPQPFAHGDLKPDNILVRKDGTLVLVDYDGMYVPAMKGQKARELGSPDFRHPSRTMDDFDEHIDDFSLASILLSLKAVSLHSDLLDIYGASDRLLFSEEDYRNISQSRFFKLFFPSDNMEFNRLMNLFMLALSEFNLSSVSSSLFNIQDPEMEYYSTEVTEEDLSNAWDDEFGVKYSVDRRRLLEVPKNLALSEYNIKEGTIAIGNNAFDGNTIMNSIFIPNTVKIIGNYTFSGCRSLLSITIPNSVTKIGKSAFSYCSSLHTIILPNGLTSIEEDTFYYCSSLQTIKFPDSLKTIKKYAFCRCDSIQIINLPNKVTSIEFGAFHECTSLRSIVIPDSVISIDNIGEISPSWIFVSPASIERFKWMLDSKLQQRLTSYTKETDEYGASYSEDGKTLLNGPDSFWFKDYPIRKGTLKIGDKAFERSGLNSIKIPNTVTTIGEAAFSGSYLLQTIKIPESVTSIGDYAFAGCNNLKSVIIPDSVTHIGEGTFFICESLENFNIPNSVLSIGSHAFGKCNSLRLITIPPSVREIYGNPFLEFKGKIVSNSKYFTVCNGNLYDSEMKTLISYNSKEKEFSIPDSVSSIGDYAFGHCSDILSVNIPNSVNYIGYRAFNWCYYLQSVTIPNTIKSIGNEAFGFCHSLLSINIPNSLTVINDYLFYGCESLRTIEIPKSVTSIGNSAFCDCSSLQEITIPDSITSIGKSAFSGCI